MAYPQIGISFGSIQNLKGLGLEFKDTFSDSSIHWSWRQFKGEVSQEGKSIVEASGCLTLGIAATKDGLWDATKNEAPRIFTGIIAYPCEIIAKLIAATQGARTQAGLFISKSPVSFGSEAYLTIIKRRAIDGTYQIQVIKSTTGSDIILASVNTTEVLPLWFKMRVSNFCYYGATIYLDYSFDGVHYTNLYNFQGWLEFTLTQPGVGLFVMNGWNATYNAISASFDFFRMLPKTVT